LLGAQQGAASNGRRFPAGGPAEPGTGLAAARLMDRTNLWVVLGVVSLVGCESKPDAAAAGSGSASAKPSAAGSSAPAGKCTDPKGKPFDKGGFCLTVPDGATASEGEKDGQWVKFKFAENGDWKEVVVQRMDPARIAAFDDTKKLLFGDEEKKDKKVVEDGATADGKGHVLVTEKEPNRWITVLTRSNKNIYRCSTWTSSSKPKEGQIEICKSLEALDQ